MPTIHLLGRVLPEVARIDGQLPELDWKWEEENISLHFRVKISQSSIDVQCDLPIYKPEYITELHKRGSDVARIAVNLICFSTGFGLTTVIETLIAPDGVRSTILPQDLSLASLCTAYGLGAAPNADLDTVAQLVLVEFPLFRALHDLIESITTPHVATVNCGRVVDSIRRMITPVGTSSDQQAWVAMQTALNIARTYLQPVTNTSTGPRHGDPAFIPGTVATDVTHRAWTVMNRFLEYRKRSNVTLTAPHFPLLT